MCFRNVHDLRQTIVQTLADTSRKITSTLVKLLVKNMYKYNIYRLHLRLRMIRKYRYFINISFQLCCTVWHYEGLRHVDLTLLGYYAMSSGKYLPKFREEVKPPSSIQSSEY
jgi:hypothetical protein